MYSVECQIPGWYFILTIPPENEPSVDLEFLEQEMIAVIQGKEFENLSDIENEQVIEQLHAKWNNLDNEVLKRMVMFKEKCPEILNPILED